MKHLNALNARAKHRARPYEQHKKQKQKRKQDRRAGMSSDQFNRMIFSGDGVSYEMTPNGIRVTSGPGISGRVPYRVNEYEGRERELLEALTLAQDAIETQQRALKSLSEGALLIGTIVDVLPNKKCLVSGSGTTAEVNLPDGCAIGSQVRIIAQTGQPLSALPKPSVFGRTVTVTSVTEHEISFDLNDGEGFAKIARGLKVEPGDRVRLDPSEKVALVNLGKNRNRYSVNNADVVTWDDIGGCEGAKEALREAIEYPVLYADLYREYSQSPSRGVLLYGPPGTGKTMLGKAAANAIGCADGFIYIKGAELLSKWVGEAEGQVRAIFERARAYKSDNGRAAVLFIDEADAILAPRGGGIGTAVASSLVPSFLAEMDGIGDSGAFVILSTNREHALDPAIVRDGRIDRRIRVDRPDRAATETIFKLSMRGRPCGSVDDLASIAVGELFSERRKLYEVEYPNTRIEYVRLRDIVSGAIVSGIANRATATAIRRSRTDTGTQRQIVADDVRSAVTESFRELTSVNHMDAIGEHIERMGELPVSIRKAAFDAGSEEARFPTPVHFSPNVSVPRDSLN